MPVMMNTTSDTVRVFFALWPADAERGRLAAWQEKLKEMGRVMRTDTLHATLVFLGEVASARLEALTLAAAEVRAARFELCFDEARYWGHNHIVYAAPASTPSALQQLVDELGDHLLQHRFKFEEREYKPHVTLLRNVHWTDTPFPAMPKACWTVRDFVLVQSQGGGANYRVLARFPLST
jgi:2'-5' RNA ligase